MAAGVGLSVSVFSALMVHLLCFGPLVHLFITGLFVVILVVTTSTDLFVVATVIVPLLVTVSHAPPPIVVVSTPLAFTSPLLRTRARARSACLLASAVSPPLHAVSHAIPWQSRLCFHPTLELFRLLFDPLSPTLSHPLTYSVSPAPLTVATPSRLAIAPARLAIAPAGLAVATSSHQSLYGAKLQRLILFLLVTAGSIVQECCFARVTQYDFIVASQSHYAVSSIGGSSQSRIRISQTSTVLLVPVTIVQECGIARFTNYIIAAPPSQYAVSSIDGSSQSQLHDFQPGVVAQRPNHPEAFHFLSDVCSHTIELNKCDDCMLRSTSVTYYWTRHGNVELRDLEPVEPSALSSSFIRIASWEAKLELEIHLVSSVSLVRFKADCACFSVLSSQLGLHTLNVAYSPRTSHLEFLRVNISTSPYRCFNVVFDYQLFFRTIAMGTKVEPPFRFLHFAEHDSPLYGFISTCLAMFSSSFLPSSMSPGFSASVVNFHAL